MPERIKQYSNTIECTVRVPAPSARYFDELCSLSCAGDLMRFFPNAKELTESFTVFNAVRKTIGAFRFGEDITCVVPGDGTAPRTGALFALRTRWNVISVDPIMHRRWVLGRHRIDRLVARRLPISAIEPIKAAHVVVAACHSHAPLSQVVKIIHADRLDVVSLPCCVPDDIGIPSRSWLDRGCWSPENRVNIYHDWKEGWPTAIPISS